VADETGSFGEDTLAPLPAIAMPAMALSVDSAFAAG
jgi:hypothetical protein